MLSIAYINNETPAQPQKVDDTDLRIKRRYYADFKKALKDQADLIKEVQKKVPGWVPRMPTDLEIKKAEATTPA